MRCDALIFSIETPAIASNDKSIQNANTEVNTKFCIHVSSTVMVCSCQIHFACNPYHTKAASPRLCISFSL